MKLLVIISVFAFLSAPLSAQYARNWYSSKPEPAINIPVDEKITQSISSQTKNIYLNNQEKELLYWMNFARKYPKIFYDSVVYSYIKTYPEIAKSTQYIYSLKKSLYNSSPLPLLILHEKLMMLAKEHANDIKKHNNPFLAHSSSDGKSFQERVKSSGLNVCSGENLSYSPSSVLMQLVLLYLDTGEPDWGHRKNLLNNNYTNIGIATIRLKSGETFFVQDFSCPFKY